MSLLGVTLGVTLGVSAQVGLTLRKHLLALQPPPPLPAIGTVVEAAVVRRVDAAVGALIEIPAHGATPAAAGYAHISNIDDARVRYPQTTPPSEHFGNQYIQLPGFSDPRIGQ